jgi:hypothetical protein
MADSSIFKYANDISINRSTKSGRSVTTGGFARTHRLGPTIYTIQASLPILSEEQYQEVENELFEMEDGINFLTVNVSSNNGNRIMSKGTVPLKSGETNIKVIKQDYSRLNQFTIVNLEPNNNDIFRVGDFMQFDNNDKVYQIYKPVGETGAKFKTSPAGTVRVRLSSPIISNIGIPTASSLGSSKDYYLVSGKGDEVEQVSYNWITTSSGTDVGKIIFKDANTNAQYYYADGTPAELWIRDSYYTTSEIRTVANQGIAGNYSGHSSLTQAQTDQNNKLGQILSNVLNSGSWNNGTLTWDFNVPNVRAELVITTATGQSMTNETVITTIINPYQDGLLTIKDQNNNILLDTSGNAITITLPKSLTDANEIYNYLTSDIMGSNSTHPVKTLGVWSSVGSGYFPEFYGETDSNHRGKINIRWGAEYDGSIIEFTTAVGTVGIDYNNYEPLNETVNTFGSNFITIENSNNTYVAGEYLQPARNFLSTSYVQKILNVSVVGTTTTINFDTTFNNSMSGWSSGYELMRHENDDTSNGTHLLKEIRVSAQANLYTSSANVLMGDDVNMKLMLTEKPSVTIIPKDETQNLYQFNSFEFTEVL